MATTTTTTPAAPANANNATNASSEPKWHSSSKSHALEWNMCWDFEPASKGSQGGKCFGKGASMMEMGFPLWDYSQWPPEMAGMEGQFMDPASMDPSCWPGWNMTQQMASLSSSSAPFVPGQSAWDPSAAAAVAGPWQDELQQQYLNWGGMATEGFSWGGETAAAAAAAPAAASTATGCVLNLDAFESSSTSSSSPSKKKQKEGESEAGGKGAAAEADPSALRTPQLSARREPRAQGSPAWSRSESCHTALESESEFSLLHSPDNGTEGSAVQAEITEKTLKRWLQLFADDGDTAALGQQWRVWRALPTSREGREVVEWLLEAGFEDSRRADTVAEIFKTLVGQDGLDQALIATCLGEYSADDLEDLRLDNPRLDAFLEVLRSPLPVRERPAVLVGDAADASLTCAKEAKCYNRLMLLRIWRLLQDVPGGRSPPNGLKWTLQKAPAPPPLPTPQTHEKPKSTRKAREARDAREEWRSLGRTTSEGGAGPPQPEVRRHNSAPVEPLHMSSTSWMAQIKRQKESTRARAKGTAEEEDELERDERFLRELRGALNKLTVEKFDSLSERIMTLISQSHRPNRGIPSLMQLVFEKATTQHHFIRMYVNLCNKIHLWLTETQDVTEMGSQVNFKRILLNQCQSSFEQYLEPPEGFEGLEGDELYEAQVKYKTKMLGNIRLVGALIRHGMLAPKVAIAVGRELLRDDPICLEERLETLAVFLESVGPCLDDPSWAQYRDFDQLFLEAQEIVNLGQGTARIRFLLRDVLDMRESRWQVQKQRDVDKESPMTLAQVHEKARQQDLSTPAKSRQNALRQRTYSGGHSLYDNSNSSYDFFHNNNNLYHHQSSSSSSGALGGRANTFPSYNNNSGNTPSSTPNNNNNGHSNNGNNSNSNNNGSSNNNNNNNNNGSGLSIGQSLNNSSNSATMPDWAGTSPSSGSKAPARSPASSPYVGPKDKAGKSAANRPRAKTGPAGTPNATEKAQQQALRKELAQVVRKLAEGSSDVASALQRVRSLGTLPADRAVEEAMDFLARVIDEPRQRRQKPLELLKALTAQGCLFTTRIVRVAIETMAKDAFAEPESVDPPELGDIILYELLPAASLERGQVRLPACLGEAPR